LACLCAAVVCSAATLGRGPYLQNVRSDRATIMWTTQEKGVGVVQFSAGGDLSGAAPAQIRELPQTEGRRPSYQYHAELTGLTPGRQYAYRVLVDGKILKDDLGFRTTAPGPFTFLVFGDSGTGNAAQAALARRMIDTENPSLVLHTGDLSQDSGTFDELDLKHFAVYGELMSGSPFFPTPGNHDYYTDFGNPCLLAHSPPTNDVPVPDAGRYYSFNWGNTHFVSLNSNLLEFPASANRMLEWLERDLSRQNRFWKVVYFHHPPYPTGHHLRDPISAIVRERVVPILERHGVQLVLSGHEHSYQRSKPLREGTPVDAGSGTVYMITGGGGGVLHHIGASPTRAVAKSAHHYLRAQVQGSRMTITAIDIDGREVDRFVLAPPAQLSAEAVLNAAFTPSLAAGSPVSIFGQSLASGEARASHSRLPTKLAGTSVTLDGQPIPLVSVSPHQIIAQLPYGRVGKATMRVSTTSSSAEVPVHVESAAPAILESPYGRRHVPAVVRWPDGTLVTPASPAAAGEEVTIYLVGLGEVDESLPDGEPAPGEPPLRAIGQVMVRIGGATLIPAFAGLTPGFAGLYQVNARVPEGTPAGRNTLRVVVNGISSEPATLYTGPAASSLQ
jgi:uncharacterized protein (TIGR03437 family)